MIEMKKSLANLTDSQKEERLLAVFVANLLHSKQTLNDGLKPIENISTSFISQYIRILYPAILNYKSGILITDIDMLPMNRD